MFTLKIKVLQKRGLEEKIKGTSAAWKIKLKNTMRVHYDLKKKIDNIRQTERKCINSISNDYRIQRIDFRETGKALISS